MAKERKGKATADKWKKKMWYAIYAPKEFDRKELGETVAVKPELLNGRTIAVGLRQLSNQIKKQHVTVYFRVNEVKGNKAYTEVVGHVIKDAFLKRFIRRRCSKIEAVQNFSTKDNMNGKVKTVVVTARKVTNKQKKAIRKITIELTEKFIKSAASDELVSKLIFGNLDTEIMNAAKKIAPIKRVEITRSRITKG